MLHVTASCTTTPFCKTTVERKVATQQDKTSLCWVFVTQQLHGNKRQRRERAWAACDFKWLFFHWHLASSLWSSLFVCCLVTLLFTWVSYRKYCTVTQTRLNLQWTECPMNWVSPKLNVPWTEFPINWMSHELSFPWTECPMNWMSHELSFP